MSPAEDRLRAEVSEDAMHLVLHGPVDPSRVGGDVARLRAEILELGVPEADGLNQLGPWLERIGETATHLEGEVFLSGTPPTEPVDERIEWTGDFFSTSFVIDEETGAIDYRQRSAQLDIEEGRELARVLAARPGEDGLDVLGRPVRARKPRAARIRAGLNVREEDRVFTATAPGRFRWVGDTLSVDDVYTIEGNVGLETGHIRHSGAVVVEGDVEAGARLEAQGDIEVHGVVEEAEVHTPANLTVCGGITGTQGPGKVTAGGMLCARFILDADVEAQGDVAVEKEIVHSAIRTRGAVNMPGGRLVGGHVTALAGVVVGQAGSEADVRTQIEVGVDFCLAGLVTEKEREIEPLEAELARIRKTIEPLLKRQKTLTAAQREAITPVLHKVQDMTNHLEGLRDELAELKRVSKEKAKKRVFVRKMLFPEVFISLGDETYRVKDEFQGPLRAVLHKGNVEILPDAG